jgi:signal transduction histidine kinase
MYLVFMFVVWFAEPHFEFLLWLRFGIAMTLFALGFILLRRGAIDTVCSDVLVGAASALGLFGICLLFILPHSAATERIVLASPAIVIGLFTHYALLRLPILMAALIGFLVSAVAWIYVPIVAGGSEELRAGIFLLFVNVLGILILMLIESRERLLFEQRKVAEHARQEARERQLAAEEATGEKTRLIAAISHDLRQPLAAAAAHLAVVGHMLERNDVVGVRSQLEQARGTVEVLGSTLEHLLATARYESGAESPRVEPVELSSFMEALYSGTVSEAGERGVELRMHLPSARVLLSTDARSMQRVMGNLVVNAIKFTACRTDRPGKVLIAARLRGSTCRLDVVDTGIGIAAADVAAIWKPYVQLAQVDRERERGLGLGLYLVRGILGRLPGHAISLRSTPGRGSCFTVTLPASRAEGVALLEAPTVPRLQLPALEPLQGTRVLLVEDDRDARCAIAALIEQWGVEVLAAPTVDDVVDAESGTRPRRVDAIVCDYRLAAGRLGTEAIAAIRAHLGYAPPAVLITGDVDLDALRAAAGENTSVLSKPFAPSILAQRLLACVCPVQAAASGV